MTKPAKELRLDALHSVMEPDLQDWIRSQPLFFVATAPLDRDGHVNVSPKGLDTFRIVDDSTIAYLDLTGSGIETVAHVRENGRIVIMFTSFDARPRIVRLHGRGEVIERTDPEWDALRSLFSARYQFDRAIIRVRVHRVASSCGWSIPLMQYKRDRDTLEKAWRNQDPRSYQATKNRRSLDDLDGLVASDQRPLESIT